MRFLSRVLGSFTVESRVSDRRLASRRRSQFGCEALEGRALLSGIPGVSVQYGNLAIIAPKASGNSAEVSIDTANHDIRVSLNGQSEEFSPSLVSNITYEGGVSGGDTFVNNTHLTELAVGYGGHNTFTGGTGFNYVEVFGNDNTYNAQAGSVSDVFEIAGTGDTVHNPDNATVYIYKY